MFDAERAGYVIDFVQCLKQVDGRWYGRPIKLMDWQREAIAEFYGNVKEDGNRQYQYLYLEIPKKNGKSGLAAALGLYHLFADGENSGEIYICAADKENAGIVFKAALAMLEQSPTLKKLATVRESTKEIEYKAAKSKMKVMSSEAYSKHGYKPSCVIFDELHAQPNRELWDVMTFGAGDAREQPVWIVLTTAGKDPDHTSIGWEIHEKARQIRDYRQGRTEGNYDNPLWLPYIYGMPDDPEEAAQIDIYDEATWYRCNPSLGHTIKIETIRNQAEDAKRSDAAERLFRWLRLNQWISTKAESWVPLTIYDKTEWDIPRGELEGLYCYPGIDLSSTTDLTAVTLVFPPQAGLDRWHTLFEAWIPREKMEERERYDHVPFREWMERGYIHATPGDCVDYDCVEARIIELSKRYKFVLAGTDPWNSRMLTQHLAKEGIEIIEIAQTMAGMSPAMKELERLMRLGQLTHEKNPCARWCFGNVKCAVDGNENMKPMKNRSNGRIDLTVAWITAMATAMLKERPDINTIIMSEDWSL